MSLTEPALDEQSQESLQLQSQINAGGAHPLLISNYSNGCLLSTAAKCFSLFIDYLSVQLLANNQALIYLHVKITSMLNVYTVAVVETFTQ